MKKQHPTVVLLLHSLFIFAAAIIGMMYAEFHGLAALFNPLYGAAIGLYLVYQKKAFPAIFGGVTLAVIVYRIAVGPADEKDSNNGGDIPNAGVL